MTRKVVAVCFGHPLVGLRPCRDIRAALDAWVLDAADLRTAQRQATQLSEDSWPLLRIDTRTGGERTETSFALPVRSSALASLVHDAALLGIARGAVIAADISVDLPTLRRQVVHLLTDRCGYRVIDSIPGWEPDGRYDRVTIPPGVHASAAPR